MTAIDETGRIYSSSFISETGDSIYSTSHNSIGRRLFNVIRTFYKTCTENVHSSDTVAKSTTRYMIALVGVQNAATNAITRLISESITTADSCSKTLTRTISDALSVTDSITMFKAIMKILTESIVATAAMGERTLTRNISETVTNADSIRKSITRALAVETISVVDGFEKIITKLLRETITVGATLTKTLSRTFGQVIEIVDSITAYKAIIKVLTESVTVATSISKTIIRQLTETTTVVLVRGKFTAHRVINQSISITNNAYKSITRHIAEAIGADDDLNWLRPIATSVKHTVASNIKKATKLILGGEELE